jgi:deoxyribodipyrimidine photolyase-related protein
VPGASREFKKTVWVLGDQLNLDFAALAQATPHTHQILMVESSAKVRSKKWHIQRAHFVITSMRRFAMELREAGFDVDYRKSETLSQGLREHRAEFAPSSVSVMEPASHAALTMLRQNDCEIVRSNQFLCHYEDFAGWKDQLLERRKTFKMEDFYRWQRLRLNYLMTPDGEPETGTWNYDSENRLPPPKDGKNQWPAPVTSELDDIDQQVINELRDHCVGQSPTGLWATSRHDALKRLDHFIENVLPNFGPHEDAMVSSSWHVAHSLLSPYLNIGLLRPAEVCDAVQDAYRLGRVDIASTEGFIRQVIGWREYVRLALCPLFSPVKRQRK